jgi:hypothetical protein
MKRRWIQDSPVRADWGIDPFPCGATIGHLWANIFARHDAPQSAGGRAGDDARSPLPSIGQSKLSKHAADLEIRRDAGRPVAMS